MDFFGDYKTDLDVTGAFGMTIPAGETVSADWTCPGVRYFTGLRYEKEGGSIFDTAKLQVVMGSTVVKQFGNDVHIFAKGEYDFYKATLAEGLKIRIVFTNNGTTEAKLAVNLVLHKDRV